MGKVSLAPKVIGYKARSSLNSTTDCSSLQRKRMCTTGSGSKTREPMNIPKALWKKITIGWQSSPKQYLLDENNQKTQYPNHWTPSKKPLKSIQFWPTTFVQKLLSLSVARRWPPNPRNRCDAGCIKGGRATWVDGQAARSCTIKPSQKGERG